MIKTNNKKFLAFIAVAAGYLCMVNVNLNRRARLIEEERKLATWLGGDECILTHATNVTPDPNIKKTVLASYPGSGKRFTFNVIEALTNHVAGDDFDFSGYGKDVLHLKTGYPHNDGTWSWGSTMDQVLLLIRNPRWAIPAYHTMRFELDFSSNFAESYTRLPFVHTHRPDVETWRTWRDNHFEEELAAWERHLNFWMDGGDEHCQTDLACYPKAVIDFDRFYQEHPTTEFYKIGHLFDAEENVEVIHKDARACVLDAVYMDKTLHHGNRDGNGPPPSYKKFTAAQLDAMINVITALKEKYSSGAFAEDPVAQSLVDILNDYIKQDFAEFEYESEAI